MDRSIREVIRILPKLIFEPPGNSQAMDDDGKRKRDRKLLEEAAKAVNLSPRYLQRLFSAEMEMTLNHYIDKLRMEKAREMVESSYLTVYQIGGEVGAGDEEFSPQVQTVFWPVSFSTPEAFWWTE